MRGLRTATGLVIAALAAAGATGCNLISGLSDLKIDEGAGGTGGSGGSGATGGGGTGGSGGTGTTTGGGGSGGTTTNPACNNGKTDGDETDVDCGGPDCAPCDAGAACLKGSDCATEICDGPEGTRVCAKATHVAVGAAHACAALDTGALYCWGANDDGQLGVPGPAESATPVLVADVVGALAVTAGGPPGGTGGHTCAITTAGRLYCWGANDAGQLGKGDTQSTATPTHIASVSQPATVAAGAEFTCATTKDFGLLCWGKNDAGQFGNGGPDGASDPLSVDAGLVQAVVAGARHACAILADDSLQCWGDDSRGQAGVDPVTGIVKLGSGPGLPGVTRAAAGQDFTCARDATTLWCWGDGSDGELTSAVADDPATTPADVGLAGVAEIALGADGAMEMGSRTGGHACALLDTGKVSCWGCNASGQLGRGTTGADEGSPAEVVGLGDAVAIAAGTDVSCAIVASGAVRCWGRNDHGQLGTGTAGDSHSSPVGVAWP